MNTSTVSEALMQHPYSNSVAAAGSIVWVWLPYVEGLSRAAAIALPILSVVWIGTQLYSHFRKNK